LTGIVMTCNREIDAAKARERSVPRFAQETLDRARP
jgi:hypothetical protein